MKKIVSLFSLLLVVVMVLAACTPPATPAPTTAPEPTDVPEMQATDTAAPAMDATATPGESTDGSTTLTLWVYDDGRLKVLQELGEKFKAEYGVGLKVEVVDLSEIRNQMTLGAANNTGPDMVIIPHDNLGPMVENGSAAPVDLGDKAKNYLPAAIAGFNYNGKLYGLPLAVENIGFFRNTDLVPDAPKTWDDVAKIGGDLVKNKKAESAISLPDLGYNIYPLYTAFGGYIFGRDAQGSFTSDDIGMGNPGMIKGLEWVQSQLKAGVISKNIDWEAAHVQFETGKSPFIMTGPWALNRFKKAGVKYAISPFPAADASGKPGYPFLGVQGIVINANKPNVVLAQTFCVEFLAREENYKAIFAAEARPSAWATVNAAATDPDTIAFSAAGVDAVPMPAIPAMGYVWDAWSNAGTLVMTGQKSPADALAGAVKQIQDQVAKNKK